MTNISDIFHNTARLTTLFAMGCITVAVAFGTVETVMPNEAFAASKSKKAQEATKRMGQSFDYLVKAGKKAQKKRGLAKGTGKAMTNVGKAGSKFSKGLNKGIKNTSKGFNKALSKSKTGRAMQKSWRKAGKWQNKTIDKAFRNCRGRACKIGKDGAKFLAPF